MARRVTYLADRFAPLSLLAILCGCEISSGTPYTLPPEGETGGIDAGTGGIDAGTGGTGGDSGTGGANNSGGLAALTDSAGGSSGGSDPSIPPLPSCQPGDTGHDVFDGDLTIDASNSGPSAHALSHIRCFTGRLEIRGIDFPLTHLAQLEQAGSFILVDVPYSSLNGLESLKRVSELAIVEAPLLSDLSAIDGIDVTGRIVIDNAPLDSQALQVFSQVTELKGGPSIDEGLQLFRLPLSDLSGFAELQYARSVSLSYNPQLSSVMGATKLHTIDKLRLVANPSLSSFAELPLPQELLDLFSDEMNDCGAALSTDENFMVRVGGSQISSLSCLQGVTQLAHLTISAPALPNLSDLSALESLLTLGITSSHGLRSLEGMTSLESVLSNLTIAGNDNLESLSGLNPAWIDADTIVTLQDNTKLPQCLVDDFAAQITPYACACDSGNDESTLCP